MNKWNIALLSSLVVVAALLFFPPDSNLVDISSSSVTASTEPNKQSLITPSLEKVAKQFALTDSMPSQSVSKITTHEQRVENMSTKLEDFFSYGRHINRDQYREHILNQLLEDEANIKLAVATLSNLQNATETFGEFQAKARVGSIELIRHAAKLGNTEPLKTAVSNMATQLNQSSTWKKGIQHDYVALVASYINSIDTDEFLNYPDPHLETIGLTEKTSVEIQKGLIDSKLRAMDSAIIKEKLAHHFQFGDS